MNKQIATLVLTVMLAWSCNNSDDDSTNLNKIIDACQQMCDQQLACNLLDESDIEACVFACQTKGTQMTSDYFDAYTDCVATADCDTLATAGENVDTCYEQHDNLCTSDVSAYVTAACVKTFECDGIEDPTATQMSDCSGVQYGDGNEIICFTQAAIDRTTDCIEQTADCSPDPVKTCVWDNLGLELGSDETGGNAGNASGRQ